MLLLRQTDRQARPAAGRGLRMLAVGLAPGRMALALTAQGARVETETDLFEAIEALQYDATGFSVAAIDCDGFGGLEAVRRVLPLLGRVRERTALVLAAAEVILPDLTPAPRLPVLLRTPVAASSLRAALGHLMRDRLVMAPI